MDTIFGNCREIRVDHYKFVVVMESTFWAELSVGESAVQRPIYPVCALEYPSLPHGFWRTSHKFIHQSREPNILNKCTLIVDFPDAGATVAISVQWETK